MDWVTKETEITIKLNLTQADLLAQGLNLINKKEALKQNEKVMLLFCENLQKQLDGVL